MMAKFFVEPDNTVSISCPKCKKTKNLDVSRFKGHIHVRIKCSCGSISGIQLEYRRHYRKKTELPGFYTVISKDEKPGVSGFMTVNDLSRSGLQMIFENIPPSFYVGCFLNIMFTLDDKNQTRVERNVEIRYIQPPYVGAIFHRASDTDNVIGFYLLR